MTPVRVRPIRETRPPESTRSHAELLAERAPQTYVQGALAVDFVAAAADDYFAPQPTSPTDLPPIEPWAAQIGKAALEVMAGQRGPAQLLRWTSPDVYNVLAHHHAVAGRRAAQGLTPRQGTAKPAVVRRVLVCTPAASVAEATVIVVHGGRVRALALRFVGEDGRWRLKALRTG